jgi:hypothetical protein
MKKIITALIAVSFLTLACAHDMVIDNVRYKPKGLFTEKDQKIEYEFVWGNAIWGAILFQTIVAPIYFYGFSLQEPVSLKPEAVRTK